MISFASGTGNPFRREAVECGLEPYPPRLYREGMTETFLDLPATRTPRLLLRPLCLDDAAAFRDMTDDPAITGPVHFLSEPFTLADAEQLIRGKEDGRDCFLGAWSLDDSLMVAVVGLHLHGDREIEIGYWVRSSQHGKGIATEAVTQAISLAQRRFPERLVMAECSDANLASQHLLLKLGFLTDGQAGRRPGRRRYSLR